MAYTFNEGQGSLFRNDKGGNDRRPDYKGSILINGVLYSVSGWVRQQQNGGQSYLSLKAEPAQRPQQQAPAPQYNPAPAQQYAQHAPAPAPAPQYAPAPVQQAPVQQAPAPTDDDLPF